MSSTQAEALQIFRDSKALLQGHFLLRSGLHSGHFFQCAQVCQYMDKVTRLIELLKPKLMAYPCDSVLAPAIGGLVVGQEVARQLGVRFVFAEKENDRLVLRRNFTFRPGERVLIAEDVVTRGGRVQECLDILKAHGAEAVAVATLVDRSGGQAKFATPFVSLLELTFPTYAAESLPPELAKLPVTKPGS